MGLLITCTLVTTLYATTITIANVSLPQIQGALSASPDQVAWIVTSNLIATAVTIPLAGWISARFGRRRAMIWGVAGFGVATLMCGLSTSLGELVFWRVLQSGFGSPLTPISQSVVIDEFTGEKRGPAVAIYSMGVGIAPTIAPLLGGYVSEEISWHWVFFILLPIAFVAFVGVLIFIKPDPPRNERAKLDWTGFLSLSIAIACVQLILDRGEREEWFDSMEIVLEFSLALLCGWIFLVHSLTSDRPFLDLRLLLERNFALGIGIATIFGMLFVTPMVMIPAMIQQLRDVPEFTVGLLIAMRGIGTVISQVMMISFAHRWSPRLLFFIGFAMHTYAGLLMARFDMNVSLSEMAWAMAIQGLGVGFLWVPMTLVTFSNFDPRRSAEGMTLFHFLRSIASSYYISASFVVVFHTQKMNYSDLVQWINPFNDRLSFGGVMGGWNTESATGLAGIVGEVTRQATTIGYINSFNLFLWTSLLVYPLVALIVWPPRGYRPRA
ncbi:MAG: DHA2 family efflux MFS transporter permease subunit [Rhodospirillaceae bacterium]|nr:DHA2 family efflux MFS transporter permease subunit [Rhodospirillaceae bacterium]MBT5810207.1 DHA2 family efflux MFS transporter permease subunit [Rhodospirillaceae bacterium]